MEHIAAELLRFLQRGERLFEQLLADAAQHWQISSSEARILLFLSSTPDLNTARDVALHCGMSKASVSGNVLKLATRDLLTVDVDLADRRFQHLTLTEQAEPVLSMIREKIQELSRQLLSPLSGQETAKLLELLIQLNTSGAES